jgi:hypothetical protein
MVVLYVPINWKICFFPFPEKNKKRRTKKEKECERKGIKRKIKVLENN